MTAPILCSECGNPATVQTLRPATDDETAAYRAQYAHLPAGCPALTDPMQVSEPVCCDHHSPDTLCPDCPEDRPVNGDKVPQGSRAPDTP